MNLLGVATDAEFWKKVKNDDYYKPYRDELLADWANFCEGRDIPPFKYSEYKLFWTTGDQKTHEQTYFRRRGILNASAILALIYPEEKKYFEKLEDVIFDLCNEYTWCLPSHIGAHSEKTTNVADLFASETAFSLAEILVLHKEKLDDFIKELVVAEIKRRIIDPTLRLTEGWWWEQRSRNNWLSVCGGSIGCTAMLLFPEDFEKLKPRIDKAMETYIESFLGEGICVEGCAYWDYGFGFFTIYADMLKTYTEGREDYFKREDVKAMAAFPQKMFLSGGAAVSFSDMGSSFYPSLGIIHYLKSIYPDSIKLPRIEACTYGIKRWRTSYIIRAVTWADKKYAELDEIGNSPEYFYFQKSQWYVNKRVHYGFTAKGGHNKEPHNHNDIGHFIYAKGGKQILVDLGAGLYDRKYFSAERYTVLETSSRGHSVPIIDGELQKVGDQYKAEGVIADENSFSLDISSAYGNEKINSLTRRFDLTDDGVALTDEFDFKSDLSVTERFISLLEPKTVCEGVLEIDGTHLLYDADICTLSISRDASPQNECYAIDFSVKPGVREFKLEIKEKI